MADLYYFNLSEIITFASCQFLQAIPINITPDFIKNVKMDCISFP